MKWCRSSPGATWRTASSTDHRDRSHREPVREHSRRERSMAEPREAPGAGDPSDLLRRGRQLPRARHGDGAPSRREARVPAECRRGLSRQQRARGDRRADRDPEGRGRAGAVRGRAGGGDRQALQEGLGGRGARLRLRLHLGNDVSERTWQRDDRTFWRGKNTDTFKPMGPWIVTGLNPTTCA
jgi:hypothetical protein